MNTPEAILYHATGGDLPGKIHQAAVYYAARYGVSPTLAAVDLSAGELPRVAGLRVVAANVGRDYVLVGVESEAAQ